MTDDIFSLLKPGDAAIRAIEKFVHDSEAPPKLDPGSYWTHDMRQILRARGRSFRGRPLPEQYLHLVGPQQQCFRNARAAAEADPSLTYYEGLYHVGANAPTPHGWCVGEDGGVVELTFATGVGEDTGSWMVPDLGPWMPPEHWAYFGAPFDPAYVAEHLATFREHISYCERDHAHTPL